MKPNYKVQRGTNHIAKEFPKTVKSFGVFVATASTSALCYGMILSPFMINTAEEVLRRDSAGIPLLIFAGMTIATGIDVIKNLRLERREKKLQAKLNKQQEAENAREDFMNLYNKIESDKRFERIEEQTRHI